MASFPNKKNLCSRYYIEKDTDSAKEYFTKKVKYVTEQMEKVQAIGNEKIKFVRQ